MAIRYHVQGESQDQWHVVDSIVDMPTNTLFDHIQEVEKMSCENCGHSDYVNNVAEGTLDGEKKFAFASLPYDMCICIKCWCK